MMESSPRKKVEGQTRGDHCAAWTTGRASLAGESHACTESPPAMTGTAQARSKIPGGSLSTVPLSHYSFRTRITGSHHDGLKGARSEAMTKNMHGYEDIRWQQRFENFERAFSLLREALNRGPAALNQLEKEGVVQRFEYTLELAWKTIKDFLESSGFVFTAVTPRQVIRDAFAAKIIADGQAWIDMIDHRNLLSHTYDPANFEEAVEAIHSRYLGSLGQVHDFLGQQRK
jgi:nucleotidyltransferase substrate binding protein (TIGR01987 family)